MKGLYNLSHKGIQILLAYIGLQANINAHTDKLCALLGEPVYLTRRNEKRGILSAGNNGG